MIMSQKADQYQPVPEADPKPEVAAAAVAPADNGVVSFSAARSISMQNRIAALAAARESWQNGAYARSNEQLYALIADCYQLYQDLTDTMSDTGPLRMGLKDYIASKGYQFKDGTALSAKIVRCVFGNSDRRRVSNYHTALRVALAQKWAVADVAKNIAALGGVQEISLGKPANALTAKQKAEQANASVRNQELGRFSSPQLSKLFDAERMDEQSVAVVTLKSDGSFVINAVVHSDSAVTAALAAYYGANKEALLDAQKNKQATQEAASREQLIKAAADSIAE